MSFLPFREVISFDFDSTLLDGEYSGNPNQQMVDLVKLFHKSGYTIIITTSRNPKHETKEQEGRVLIKDFVKENDLPIQEIIFTNHHQNGKGPFLREAKALMHFDDREDELLSAADHGIIAVRT